MTQLVTAAASKDNLPENQVRLVGKHKLELIVSKFEKVSKVSIQLSVREHRQPQEESISTYATSLRKIKHIFSESLQASDLHSTENCTSYNVTLDDLVQNSFGHKGEN